ncbi:ABC transporter permease [Proteiniclasticum sp. SCR006]|uniref:ABC transporter permease n=1 Tax=Proteiniclasticum aestuarii TaxID=2817862 RepID=A0A939KJG2_9CLOT|nr:ABC transporter permease [Proteiniclasticum aestuarii]MBO1265138.1 ABC transporter permease [Proteiniclasticum aestuarii]
MKKYLLKRILGILPALIGLSVLIFLLTRLMPGDSIRLAAGTDATQAQIEALREEMGLNKPLFVQYIDYMKGLFTGDWGYSLRTKRNVFLDIGDTFAATFELSLLGMIFAVVIGVPLGVLAAVRNNRFSDQLIRLTSLSGIAIPRFFLAILLQFVFAYLLGWFPVIGRGDMVPADITGLRLLDSLLTLNGQAFADSFRHILLPALALSVASAAQIMRLTRTNMMEQLSKEYIVAAYSYGLPKNLIFNRYMLKNAFISVLTTIGMQFSSLIGSAFLVETVFGWPGMASYSIAGLMYKDYNAIIGVTLVIGAIFAISNLLVDIAYGIIDPQIRLGKA